MSTLISRRRFLTRAGTAGVSLPLVTPWLAEARSPNESLSVGFVAAGGRAGAHTAAAHKMGLKCRCFAEVDRSRWTGVLRREGWEKAAGYTDWRKMFEKHAKDLDVVFVATPDHSHFAPSMTAISLGIHCYTEKRQLRLQRRAVDVDRMPHVVFVRFSATKSRSTGRRLRHFGVIGRSARLPVGRQGHIIQGDHVGLDRPCPRPVGVRLPRKGRSRRALSSVYLAGPLVGHSRFFVNHFSPSGIYTIESNGGGPRRAAGC